MVESQTWKTRLILMMTVARVTAVEIVQRVTEQLGLRIVRVPVETVSAPRAVVQEKINQSTGSFGFGVVMTPFFLALALWANIC